MKYLFFSFLAVAFIACTGSDKHGTSSVHGHSNDSMAQEALKDTASYTTIEWVDSVHTDLGKISEGQSIEISWQFKNTGTKPLIIQNVTAGCGCTIAEKPEQPVSPGENGVIKAKFNSAGQGAGHVQKSVTVIANTKGNVNHALSFSADISK